MLRRMGDLALVGLFADYEVRRCSTGHVEYCVRTRIAAIEEREGVPCGENHQLHLPKLGVFPHFGHHR